MIRSMRLRALAAAALAALIAGCGSGDEAADRGTPQPRDFAETREAARGQTVRWWMFGGDARVNAYVDDIVIPAARRLGVELERVPVADTADAVQRVVAQRRAGRDSGGAVDLIWINGENFAAGKKAGLWLEDWATDLPNARFVDPEDPSVARDFGVPVEGQEAPWSRAAFVFAHDDRRTPEPPRSFEELLAWARENPGRFAYPAPPDFTGSAFVRQAVAVLGEDEAFAYLRELEPLTYRQGRVLPKSEAELSRLFADGQVDLAMSYDAAFVAAGVGKGLFARSTRPLLFEDGALQNVSFVTIPRDAAHPEGAQVVADLLLDPRLQARKADPEVLGHPTVLDPGRLPEDGRMDFAAIEDSPYVLTRYGRPRQELAADEVPRLEQRWRREVLGGS